MTNVTDLHVRVDTLASTRVASVRAFGGSPEQEAWQRLREWAEPAGLLEQPAAHPVFGFNNPPARPGQAEYGYEFWIAVGPDANTPSGIEVKDFPGGRYAVTSCRVGDVPQSWKALLRWVHSSDYTWRRSAQELERILNPLATPNELLLELYLPLED